MSGAKVTIKDVAREAGVSISTVSNALNDVDVLAPETKNHVLEVAERLHYVPNLNGKNLKAKATNVIGLFITSITGDYYSALADSIYQSCKHRGYDLHIYISDNSKSIMANVLGKRVDGAVILDEYVKDSDINVLKESGVPIVFVDREIESENVSSVVFDSYHEGELVANFLLEKGNESFMLIKGERNNFDSIERARGFLNVLGNAGITVDEKYIFDGLFNREVTYKGMSEFLDKKLPLPDAIFAENDASAIGAMEALLDRGFKVPDDVSIIGCDDIEIAKLLRPSLSTIRTSYEKQGALAVDLLISMIRDGASGTKIILRGNIVSRESTKERKDK